MIRNFAIGAVVTAVGMTVMVLLAVAVGEIILAYGFAAGMAALVVFFAGLGGALAALGPRTS